MIVKSKRFLFIAISVIVALLLIFTTFLSVFGPRKLKNELPQDGIVSVTLVNESEHTWKEISKDKIVLFQKVLDELTYIKRFDEPIGCWKHRKHYLIKYNGCLVKIKECSFSVFRNGEKEREIFFYGIFPSEQFYALETLFAE